MDVECFIGKGWICRAFIVKCYIEIKDSTVCVISVDSFWLG
jgi:hypothetical protein